ncbi:YqaJ viral recombinase family protein [Ekhidna sp.]
MVGAKEILETLGVSKEEQETLRSFHKRQEEEAQWIEFSEEQSKERIAKLTASSDHRLMAGVDDTLDDRIRKIQGSFKRKSELIDYAKSLKIEVDDSMTMKDISEKVEPLTRGQLSTGALTYIEEKIIESLTGKPISDYESPDMAEGKEREEETVWWFEKNFKPLIVSEWGIKQKFHKDAPNKELDGYIGCTPDGYIKSINYGFEGKAPKYQTHYRYIYGKRSEGIPPLRKETLREIEPRYYWQIIKGLYVTGWQGWIFTSYNSDFKKENERSLTFFISREEVLDDIQKLEIVSLKAVEEMKKHISENKKILSEKAKYEKNILKHLNQLSCKQIA